MTILTDAPGVEPATDTDPAHHEADGDEQATARTELVRLLAQAFVDAPLFA